MGRLKGSQSLAMGVPFSFPFSGTRLAFPPHGKAIEIASRFPVDPYSRLWRLYLLSYYWLHPAKFMETIQDTLRYMPRGQACMPPSSLKSEQYLPWEIQGFHPLSSTRNSFKNSQSLAR